MTVSSALLNLVNLLRFTTESSICTSCMYLQGKEPFFITVADSQICPLNSFGSADEQKGEGEVGRGDFDQLVNEKDFVFYPYKTFYKCERQLYISFGIGTN